MEAGVSESQLGAALLLALLVLVGIVATVGTIRLFTHEGPPAVHTWNGVTWQGDDCRVLEDLGVIVCRGPIT